MMSEGSVLMNIDPNKERESLNEDEAIQNKVLHGGQILLKDNVLKIETNNNNGNDVTTFGLQGRGVLQAQQQLKPRGTVVCWDKLLHVRSIQVMLVENDDSTRHVVSALLRNCNYEVVEATNGLQAWKLLEDLTNHIDLVLTEVVMPCVSGIVLLSKIKSHKTHKNIPVIMMSSHDSMGLVFECLSKGAADFLVKPVRKNELKNLWQHVWKRCHSSSGSGSESGTRTRKSVKSRSNSGSYDGANNESNGLEDVGDGSEDGSDAQSSWMKQAVEVGRSKAMSPIDQLADCPDSTSAQDTCSNAEVAANKMLQNIIARKAHKGKEHDTVAKGKSFQTVIPRNSESQSENPNESHLELQGAEQLSLLGIDCNINNNQVDKGQFKTTGECLFSKHKDVTANTSSPWIDCKVSECTREVANISEIYNNVTDKSKKTNKELSLKRFRGVQEIGRTVQDDRCVLRHSEQSAFSRYNTSSNVFKTPNGITGSSSVVDCSVESATRETAFDIQAHSIDHLLCQSSKGSSNNMDMGSTTKKLSTFLPIVKDKSEATSTINPSALRPVKNDLTYTQQKVNLVIHNDVQTTENLAVARGSNEDALHPYHHHHHHHHCHHHCHNFPILEQQPPSDHNELSLKKLTAYSPRSGSSNVFGEPMDANLRNYSLNGHASGSKHGRNGQNGSSTGLGFNAESDLGQAGKNGSEDASGSGSGNKRGENKLALQKDALNKICQKRKER